MIEAGVVHLGLSPSEILDFTPAQLTRLWRTYREKRRSEVYPLALLVARYFNAHRAPTAPALDVEQFMPFPVETQRTYNGHNDIMSTEDQKIRLKMWAIQNGAIVRKRGT